MKVIKPVTNHKVNWKAVTSAEIKASKKDTGGNFYVFDLFDASGKILAKNRYVFVDSVKQPFGKLTAEDELTLNPIVESGEKSYE